MWFPKDEAPNNTALWLIAFTSKRVTNAETWYSNIKREAQSILHSLEVFHH